MANVIGKWEGGRVIRTASGKQVYYIRKRLGGRLYEVSTGATTLKAALKHWERFQGNPETYEPSGALPGKPVIIMEKLDAYADWCRTKPRPNSANWVYQKRRYLTLWADALPRDVRRWTEDIILKAMKDQSVPHNRLASLKAFCTWLRKVDRSITRAEEVTADMEIEPLAPAKWSKPRVISKATYGATFAKLDAAYHDIITVQAACGMHTTEVYRLSKGLGSVVGNVLTIFHKSGDQHSMEVAPEVAAAATRLLARGGFSQRRYEDAVTKASEAAAEEDRTVQPWAPGCLRHSAASWMAAEGIPLETIATYLNHDLATLKRHYVTATIPRPRKAG